MTIYKNERQKISANEILTVLARGDEIELTKCTIEGPLDINRFFDEHSAVLKEQLNYEKTDDQIVINFPQKINFNGCVFEDDVIFASPWSEKGKIVVAFKDDIYFNSSTFKAQTRFTSCNFSAHAGFDGCIFEGVACFRGVKFSGPAMYRTSHFCGYGLFNNAVFESNCRFSSTLFSKGVNFTSVQFLRYTDFAGVYAGSKTVPVYDNVKFAKKNNGDDESFWRFIKQCAQDSGYYQLAGETFYRERCAHLWFKLRGNNYEQLSFIKKCYRQIIGIRLLPEIIFGRLLFGYGERPIRVLASSALLILFCAVIYSQQGGHVLFRGEINGQQNFLDYLYFSVTTFATLGLGDVYPVGDSFIRLVVMAEVLGGACLMSLFVVSLAKRFSRN